MIIGVCGHRPERLGVQHQTQKYYDKVEQVFNRLSYLLIGLNSEDLIMVGDATGFDRYVTMWALSESIPIHKCCIDKTIEDVYEHPYSNFSKTTSFRSYNKRDRYIADNCDDAVICWDGNKGNVAKFAKRVKNRQCNVFNLWEIFDD